MHMNYFSVAMYVVMAFLLKRQPHGYVVVPVSVLDLTVHQADIHVALLFGGFFIASVCSSTGFSYLLQSQNVSWACRLETKM